MSGFSVGSGAAWSTGVTATGSSTSTNDCGCNGGSGTSAAAVEATAEQSPVSTSNEERDFPLSDLSSEEIQVLILGVNTLLLLVTVAVVMRQ